MKAPKRPNMNAVREHKLSEALRGLKHMPNQSLVKAIDSRNFSLDGNTVFRYKPEVLAAEEYKRCLSLLERRAAREYAMTTPETLMSLQISLSMLMNVIFTKEMNHQDELTKLAADTVRELFDIPEHVNLLPELKSPFEDSVDEQDENPEAVLSLSPEEQRKMREEIEKRVILNGLVHGSAMHIWKSSHYIIKEKIDAIDPMLMDLYNSYTASIGWMMWMMSPQAAMAEIDEHGMTQGQNQLKFDEPGEAGCDIECSGINFPVLLHEVTKGAMDYLICHGIPQEYTEDELKYYYAKADSYENEYWHYLLSPQLWISFTEATGMTTQELPLAIARLTQLSYQDLSAVMKACIDSPEAGALKLKEFKIV